MTASPPGACCIPAGAGDVIVVAGKPHPAPRWKVVTGSVDLAKNIGWLYASSLIPYVKPCSVESAANANDVVAFLVFHSELRANRLAPIVGAGGAGTAGITAGADLVGVGGAAGTELWVGMGGAGDLCDVVEAAAVLDAPADAVAGVVDGFVVGAPESAFGDSGALEDGSVDSDAEPLSLPLTLGSGERLAPRAAGSWR